MPTRRLVLTASLAGIAGCSLPPSIGAAQGGGGTLAAYAGEAEMVAALERWRSRAQDLRRARRAESAAPAGATADSAMQLAPSAPLAMAAAKSAAPAESITNVQTAGVDEGGIVKRAGDHLVILRRGRLFTVRIGGGALEPVAAVDAYAPGSDPAGAWYDELLVAGSTVVVIGYSYARGGTEIGLFDLRGDGALTYRSTYHLRSNDYYASRNYASRLIEGKLILYTPMVLQPWGPPPWEAMPGVRRWQGAGTPAAFERILPATRVFRTDDDFAPGEPLALHTVVACDLSGPRMACESTAVLGPVGRVFYVAQESVYVWTAAPRRRTGWRGEPADAAPGSAVFRIPLGRSAPTALKTAGVPIDQLSFLEDGGHLNVLLREDGAGEGMWGAERGRGGMALLRVPLAAFGDGSAAAGPEHYRRVPAVAGAVQNRHVGDWLLWGGGDGRIRAVRPAGAAEPHLIDAGHRIERIEALGGDAVLVGNRGADLTFTALRLAGDAPRIASRHVQPGMAQGETRTHGFFYRPTDADQGLLGLPVLGPRERRGGVYGADAGSASVLFLRQRGLAFTPLGGLDAQPARSLDDGCKASCVDWYGNARPIFVDGRVLALLGYELVEGDLVQDGWGDAGRERLLERRRISFAPDGRGGRTRRWSPFG